MAKDKFIVSDDDSELQSDDEDYSSKKKKVTKKEKKVKREVKDEDDDDEEEEKKPKKKVKKQVSEDDDDEEAGLKKNGSGEMYVELSNNRRVTVRKFKTSILIDVRETYEKDGVSGLPGKKGISLTPEQWKKLKESSSLIDQAISQL